MKEANEGLKIEFFLPMKIPSVTDQEKRIAVRNGKPVVYKDARLRDAKQKFISYLAQYRPEKPLNGAVELKVGWFYAATGKHKAGEFKITKPDTDNLLKLFKDCMTEVGFWRDDAQVAREATEKVYVNRPGVYVFVREIGPNVEALDDENE